MTDAANAPLLDTAKPTVDTDRKLTNEIVGQLVAQTGSQTEDLVAALDAITAAINAKPSA